MNGEQKPATYVTSPPPPLPAPPPTGGLRGSFTSAFSSREAATLQRQRNRTGNLCALCVLCVRKIMIVWWLFLYFTQSSQRAQSFLPLHFTLALEESQATLRQESAEVGLDAKNRLTEVSPSQPLRSLRAKLRPSSASVTDQVIFALSAFFACENSLVW